MAICNRRSWIILIFLSTLLFSCNEEKEVDLENFTVEELSGKEIYESRCITCHGSKGDLGISGAADLSTSKTSHEEKVYTITFGGKNPIMTPFQGLLNENEIESVAKYIETLKK